MPPLSCPLCWGLSRGPAFVQTFLGHKLLWDALCCLYWHSPPLHRTGEQKLWVPLWVQTYTPVSFSLAWLWVSSSNKDHFTSQRHGLTFNLPSPGSPFLGRMLHNTLDGFEGATSKSRGWAFMRSPRPYSLHGPLHDNDQAEKYRSIGNPAGTGLCCRQY